MAVHRSRRSSPANCWCVCNPTPGPEDPTTSLSDREREVLNLLAKGFAYQEIAELLGISTHTVRTYVRRLYEKLQVTSRGQAVFEAQRMHLLPH